MRTVPARLARDPAIDAGLVLARKASDAVVRVGASRRGTKTSSDGGIARVSGIAAVLVALASTSARGEATCVILAAGRKASFADRTGIRVVTQQVESGARRAERARLAPGQAAVQNAAVGYASVDAAVFYSRVTSIDSPVQIDGRIAPCVDRDRGCSGLTTADRRRSGQQNKSKETHLQGGRQTRESRMPVRALKRSAAAPGPHPGR